VSGGLPAGDQVEVYTFLHAREQTAGVIKMALDYASRYEAPPNKESCGTGLFSELEYQVLVLARGRRQQRRVQYRALRNAGKPCATTPRPCRACSSAEFVSNA
jgi:hypothetical protein